MKIIIKLKIISLLFLTTMFGCQQLNDVVDIQPTTLISEETALVSLDNYESLLMASYASARGYYNTFMFVDELLGPNFKTGTSPSGPQVSIYEYAILANNGTTQGIWSGAYTAINRANIIIKRLPSTTFTGDRRNRILGEAYAIRAMAHFDLLRCFAKAYSPSNGGDLGVPYYTEPAVATDSKARNTINEVYSGIFSDLAQAQNLINNSFNSEIARISKLALTALKARIHLYRGEWASAVTESTSVINTSGLSLQTGTSYSTMWTSAESAGEIIFKFRYAQGEGSFGSNFWVEANDLIRFGAVGSFTGGYTTNDVRGTTFFATSASSQPGTRNLVKYRGSAADFGRADLKVIRLSEMYLIRAEANARLNQIATASTDYNLIRNSRITPNLPVDDLALVSQNTAIIKILAEKNRELVAEGHTWMDLKRLNLGLLRTDHNVTGITDPTFSVPATSPIFMHLPIPQRELDANPNMRQNPGY
ncbi:MAG: RagB/SusD family nutrient uptake outer membrane protein [Cytophagia bacterium]|nr:MAG: RagB/SusD family nutrient uptake outer membrane protein [Cytophagales bacterium]TAG03832.1 MAG: RagB/SusD family nutrient uptake outer membrane protein [Cytophagia bacterium]TAG39528.1 MAG: RagB/SusD family nutrient uptake outer membrane protein [Cytophagia bacterium]